MDTELRKEQGVSEVVAWRRDQLVAAGFTLPLASRVARDSDYDLHSVVDLAARGCPPKLAVRILAPANVDGAA
jgi:hypothetical protein